MPRAARTKSSTGVYHIMLRGVNRQHIFGDDADRLRFLAALQRFREDLGVELYAWCLMGNHVHLLLGFGDASPELLMKKLSCSYVPYFNRRYDRVGHLFQDRFRSENVENEAYLAAVMRYIHKNPEKAGISPMEAYRWSSYREYTGRTVYADTAPMLDWFGGRDAFEAFMQQADEEPHMDVEEKGPDRPEPESALAALLGQRRLEELSAAVRRELLRQLRAQGYSVREISRAAHIPTGTLYGLLR